MEGGGSDAQKLTAAQATLEELKADLDSESAKVRRFRELVKEAGRIQAEFSNAKKDLYKRRKTLRKLEATLQDVKSHEADGVDLEELAGVLNDVRGAQQSLNDVLNITPETGSLFTRAWLGRVNVRAPHRQDRLKMRDEYNKFKNRTNIAFIVFPIIRLLVHYQLEGTWRYTHWVYQLTHIWLLYYFVSLALRENILAVNGSNIRPWWIYHHYVSAMMSVVVLMWPDTDRYRAFNPQFSVFFLYQGFVQVLQAWYQRRRHYVQLALQKVRVMDVATSETLTETPKELYGLVFFIFGAHLFQVFNGMTLLYMVLSEMDLLQPFASFQEELQALTLGLSFLLLGSMNFHQTVETLRQKRRRGDAKARLAEALKRSKAS